MGIEPTTSAWKAEVIPLYDGRIFNVMQNLIYNFNFQCQ